MARLGLYGLLPHRRGEGGTPATFKANLKRKVKCIRNAGTYERVVIAAVRQRLKTATGATYYGRLHQQQETARRRRAASLKPRLQDGTFAPPEKTIGQGTCPVGGEAEAAAPDLKETRESGSTRVRA
jgi:hypothetical protein